MLVSDLIEETRNLLFTGTREERNKLSVGIGAGDSALTVAHDIGSINRGAKLSIDLEDIYVWKVASQTADPIDRGQFGSTAAAHSTDAPIFVNPKFSNYEMWAAINKELYSLTSPANGLFTVQSFEMVYNPSIVGYDFPHTVIDVFEVRYRTPGVWNNWVPSGNWEFMKAAGDDFGSGNALFVYDGFPGQDVLIKAKMAFNQLPADMNYDTDTALIPATILDILSIGAAWRLTSSREVKRNFDETQGDARRAVEVQSGGNLGASRELGRIRQIRINEEASRLSQQYPSRSHRYPFFAG